MNQKDYDELSVALLGEADGIERSKRPGYTQGNSDVLKNFKSVGERVQTTCPHCGSSFAIGAAAAWGVYFLKHIDAVVSAMTRPDLPVSEAPLGRFSDAINYLKLGFGIFREREEATTKSKPEPSA